jgi:hypothetical protein
MYHKHQIPNSFRMNLIHKIPCDYKFEEGGNDSTHTYKKMIMTQT